MKTLKQYIKEELEALSSQEKQEKIENEEGMQDIVKSNNDTIKDLEQQKKSKKDTLSVKTSNNPKINTLDRQKKEEEIRQTELQINAVKKNNQNIVDLEAEKKRRRKLLILWKILFNLF